MNHKKKLFLLFLICSLLSFLCCYEAKAREVTDDSLLRFHIIANSDSPFDQQVKLALRDEIIDTVNAITASAGSAEEAITAVNTRQEEIRTEANAFLKQCGVPYRAEIKIGKSVFPTKSYGDLTLPAGKYQALKIVLGEGKGKNWWCVLYPSLCFVKISEKTAVARFDRQKTEQQTGVIPAGGGPQQTVIRSRLWELLCQ